MELIFNTKFLMVSLTRMNIHYNIDGLPLWELGEVFYCTVKIIDIMKVCFEAQNK